MNEADQLLAQFHPIASSLLFAQIHSFQIAAKGIDRQRSEGAYRALCEQSVRTLRLELETEAHQFLQCNQDAPQIGAIDLHLRQVVQDYLYQFQQRCG